MTSDPPKKPSKDDEYDGPSKSSRKRAAHAVQDLGAELISMRDSELAALNLPESLVDAVQEARRITARGGLARQRQYIGKLMRDVDPEPIRAFLASRNSVTAHDAERFKRVEAWRERLILEGAPALEELERWRPGTGSRRVGTPGECGTRGASAHGCDRNRRPRAVSRVAGIARQPGAAADEPDSE